MMVANPNPPGNPNSSNSAADKEVVLKAHAALLSIVDQLVSNVWDAVAAHATFDQFERSAGKNTGICLSVWNIDRELAQELWLLGELVDGRDPLKSPERTTQCPDWSEVVDKLWERGAVVARQLTLADAGRSEVSEWRIRHPDGAPILGLPRIHIGPLGTGNSLQRDNGIFDRLSVDVAESVSRSAKGPSDEEFLRFLRRLYPGTGQNEGTDGYVRPLEPDLLGESLVFTVLSDANTSSQFLTSVCADGELDALRVAFTVLGRLAWRHERDARPWVRQLLEADVANRAVPALRAALSLGEESAFAPVGEGFPFGFAGGVRDSGAENSAVAACRTPATSPGRRLQVRPPRPDRREYAPVTCPILFVPGDF